MDSIDRRFLFSPDLFMTDEEIAEAEKPVTFVSYTTSDKCWCQPFDVPTNPRCPMHGDSPTNCVQCKKPTDGTEYCDDCQEFNQRAEAWHLIADEFKAQGYQATLEGGGAACPFIFVTLADGRMVAFGDVNENWTGDVYPNEAATETGDFEEDGSKETAIPIANRDPQAIVSAFREAFGR